MAVAPEETGGSVYTEYIKEQLEAQQKRKESLEARGQQLITVAGALVTLLFGLAALATQAHQTYTLPSEARGYLYGALAMFVLAALAARRSSTRLSNRRF
jgi:hypothetical protein